MIWSSSRGLAQTIYNYPSATRLKSLIEYPCEMFLDSASMLFLSVSAILSGLVISATSASPARLDRRALTRDESPTGPQSEPPATPGRDCTHELAVWMYEPAPRQRRQGQRWRTLFVDRPGVGTLIRVNAARRPPRDLEMEVSRGAPPTSQAWKALMGALDAHRLDRFLKEAHDFGLEHPSPVDWMDACLSHVVGG